MTPSEIKSSIIFPFIFHSYRVKSLRSRSPLSRFRSLVSLLRNPFHRDTDILNANLKLTPRKKNKKMCSAIIVHPKKKEEKNNLRRVAGDWINVTWRETAFKLKYGHDRPALLWLCFGSRCDGKRAPTPRWSTRTADLLKWFYPAIIVHKHKRRGGETPAVDFTRHVKPADLKLWWRVNCVIKNCKWMDYHHHNVMVLKYTWKEKTSKLSFKYVKRR